MLQRLEAQAVAICTPVSERCHWVRRTLASGRSAVVELPLSGAAREVLDLAEVAARSLGALVLAGDIASGETGAAAVAAVQAGDLGTPLYARLGVATPRSWVARHRDGVLAQPGSRYLRILTAACGPVDSVYARTRALATNRPAEDLAVAQIRFTNGIEGLLEVGGVSEASSASFTILGTTGERTWPLPSPTESSVDLARAYADLAAVSAGADRPQSGAAELSEIALLTEWIAQSARRDTELWRRDVDLS
ncbi:MAG: Gfo/Idh/MocA family oxidoreductase [Gemmatimonadota bacterium]